MLQQNFSQQESFISLADMRSKKSDNSYEWIWNFLPFKLFLIAIYLGLNISLNMLNKWTLSMYGFRFPIFMSLAHMAFTFVALAPLMATTSYRELHVTTIRKQWIGLIGIGTFFAVNVGFNNVSLLAISLSLNQVIRASIPVVTAVGSIFIEGKNPSRREFASLLVLVFGVCIAVYEGSGTHASLNGIVLCLLGTVSNGLMMSSIGRLMSEKLDVLRLAFYTAPITCIVLIPFYWKMEADQFVGYQTHHGAEYAGLLLIGCVNALAYNIVHSLVIKITSSVTTTVLGEMKIVLILVLSAMMLGEARIWTLKMLIGCTTAILGFCMYSHCRLAAGAQPWQPVIKGVPELAPSLSDSARSSLLAPKASRS
mmetsp:Transcript_16545/g.35792  ORF Transcript_16545/g.35792 Transcript_16545/m.35792 type:complete len:368 (+) Transcript_16545:182-1285(+)